jgi:hypothetical protein
LVEFRQRRHPYMSTIAPVPQRVRLTRAQFLSAR